jgi:putative transposase
MVQYRRNIVEGATYFFTLTLRDRTRTTLTDHADALRAIVQEVRKQIPFTIDAMVILPEHLHAVWTLPEGDSNYVRRLRLMKARFTSHLLRDGEMIAKDARGEYAVWQKRYWEHTIRDETDFEMHINYVHFNPVKHGYVKRASDWPHSSIHRYIRSGLVSADWACDVSEGEFGES